MTDPDVPDPDRKPQRTPEESSRNGVSLWILVGLMVLIAVGGLVYGLSYPSLTADNSPQTVGSAASHERSGHPL